MRLIDADALLDALDKSAIYGWSLQEDAAARRWAERVVELMPTAEPEASQWIPASERLPEEGERAILKYSNGKISGGTYIGSRTWDVDFGDTDPATSVVEWRPE